MKSVNVVIGGKGYDLKVTWAASAKIAQEVADPILISQELGKEAVFAEAGMNYVPRVQIGAIEAHKIVHIALIDNGIEMAEDELGEHMVSGDMLAVNQCAADILAAIIAPGEKASKKAPAAKKRRPRTGSK